MDRAVNIVAIETATTACGIGLVTNAGEIIRVIDEDRQHTEALTEGLGTLLHEAGITAKDIDRVVVDHGPGLFTGLRVGIATAIALAQGIGAELVGVSSLELLAYGAHDAGVTGRLLCAVDGRRGEVFVQSFMLGGDMATLDAPQVLKAGDVTEVWSSGEALTVTGDGVSRYEDVFSSLGATIFSQDVPSLHSALVLGAVRPAQATIAPLYLREADAVANFTTRERQ